MTDFLSRERSRHWALRGTDLFPRAGTTPGRSEGRDDPFALPGPFWMDNLDPAFVKRVVACRNFVRDVGWLNLTSSVVCCINHLLPFATEPAALARLLEPIFGPGLEMLPMTGCGLPNEPWYVAFEYTGPPNSDFLHENLGRGSSPERKRTSIDAVVRFRREDRTELVLIEWKYTEYYGDRTREQADDRHERRLRPLVEAHSGLLRAEVAIPFHRLLVKPFYQMMRQQLLAREIERARVLDADVVRVLHLSPRANKAFARIPVAEFEAYGATTTEAWAGVLARPDRFTAAAIEDVFGPSVHPDAAALLTYARRRYAFTSDRARGRPLRAKRSGS